MLSFPVPVTPHSLPSVNAWDLILQILEEKVGAQNFSTWFKSTAYAYEDGPTLFVTVPNATCKDWINEHYLVPIAHALEELHLPFRTVEFMSLAEQVIPKKAPAVAGAAQEERLPVFSPKLNDRYQFGTFVVGASNQFAHAACRSVAHDPAGSYNPLFLYGGVGLGKTHLMHAIGHELQQRLPHWRVCYVSAENFINEMIQSLKDDRMSSFREWIRNVDALLVDDVQILAGKERTQEEFFHTFNTIYESRKQIVLSSDCPPKSIAIEERLRSRFEWGLIADIQLPDLETRQAILMKKAEADGFDLPEDVALFIANNVRSNIRELEGCLVRLTAHCSLANEELTEAVAEKVLKNLIHGNQKEVTIEMIQKVVSDHFGLKSHELKARNNSKRVVFPRQIAMWISRELTRASLPEIARSFGDKHHTTVLHSVEKITQRRKIDRDLQRKLSQLMASFQ